MFLEPEQSLLETLVSHAFCCAHPLFSVVFPVESKMPCRISQMVVFKNLVECMEMHLHNVLSRWGEKLKC